MSIAYFFRTWTAIPGSGNRKKTQLWEATSEFWPIFLVSLTLKSCKKKNEKKQWSPSLGFGAWKSLRYVLQYFISEWSPHTSSCFGLPAGHWFQKSKGGMLNKLEVFSWKFPDQLGLFAEKFCRFWLKFVAVTKLVTSDHWCSVTTAAWTAVSATDQLKRPNFNACGAQFTQICGCGFVPFEIMSCGFLKCWLYPELHWFFSTSSSSRLVAGFLPNPQVIKASYKPSLGFLRLGLFDSWFDDVKSTHGLFSICLRKKLGIIKTYGALNGILFNTYWILNDFITKICRYKGQ